MQFAYALTTMPFGIYIEPNTVICSRPFTQNKWCQSWSSKFGIPHTSSMQQTNHQGLKRKVGEVRSAYISTYLSAIGPFLATEIPTVWAPRFRRGERNGQELCTGMKGAIKTEVLMWPVIYRTIDRVRVTVSRPRMNNNNNWIAYPKVNKPSIYLGSGTVWGWENNNNTGSRLRPGRGVEQRRWWRGISILHRASPVVVHMKIGRGRACTPWQP